MKRVHIEVECQNCRGSGTVRSPQQVAADYAQKVGIELKQEPYPTRIQCPRCSGSGWVQETTCFVPAGESYEVLALARELRAVIERLQLPLGMDLEAMTQRNR